MDHFQTMWLIYRVTIATCHPSSLGPSQMYTAMIQGIMYNTVNYNTCKEAEVFQSTVESGAEEG